MSVPALYETKYKAKSYGMFITLIITLFVLLSTGFIMIDHSRKSDQPLTGLFIKSKEQYISENETLAYKVDSLQVIAAQVPTLKKALKSKAAVSVTSNVQVPNLGHYQDRSNLKKKNYQAYLVEKLKFYYHKSEIQEKFIQNNF